MKSPLRCKKHMSYGAKRPPRANCAQCDKMWAVAEKMREAAEKQPKGTPGPIPRAARAAMLHLSLGTELSPNAAAVKPQVLAAIKKAGTDISQCAQLIDAFCEAYAEWVDASQEVKKYGLLVPGSLGTIKQNPAVRLRRDASSLMIRLAEQLGMTPKSKHAMGEAGAPPLDDDDKFLES